MESQAEKRGKFLDRLTWVVQASLFALGIFALANPVFRGWSGETAKAVGISAAAAGVLVFSFLFLESRLR